MFTNFSKINQSLIYKKINYSLRFNRDRIYTNLCSTHLIRFSSSNDGDKINDKNFESSTATATEDELDKNENKKFIDSKDESERKFNEIDFFAPKDSKTILPGNIGFCPESYKQNNLKKKNVKSEFNLIKNHAKSCNKLTTTIEQNLNNFETIEDRQNRIIENAVYNLKEDESLKKNSQYFKNLFFVKSYQCTQLLKEDIKKLFPEQCLFKNDYTIITVYKNPFMKKNSLFYKQEFFKLGSHIIEILNKSGYWANYIGSENKKSIFDDISKILCNFNKRFDNYGIEIESFGQCKLSSHINESTLFIGSIFTTAELESSELKKIMNLLTEF